MAGRRESVLAAFAVALHLCLVASASSSSSSSSSDGSNDWQNGRTAYHYQPATNWMNVGFLAWSTDGVRNYIRFRMGHS
ncbi:hypothetical protein ACP70R_015903 [Stipagrostis hirtigluma subsp. patula]